MASDHGAQAQAPAPNPYDIAPAAPGNAPPEGAATDPDPATPPGGPPWSGEVHIMVLLIQFPDYPASSSHDAAYFEDLLFGHQAGSMWDFYNENSYGQFSINGTVVPVWLNATHNMTYYGNYEFTNSEAQGNAQTLVREAVQLADQYVDFGPFDEDGDGYVDHLAMVHSGPTDESNGGGGPAGDPAIWSHRWGISAEQVDGVNVTGYFMQGEGTPMGVFAHEYGHNLGLPDLYDTDYSSSGIGRWGIMSGGSWNNGGRTPAQFCAWSKIAMGWLEPTIPSGTTANLTVPRVEDHAMAFKLPIGGLDSAQYFLIENRQKVLYDAYLPGHGLLIWHIDEEASQPNDAHRLVDLEEFDNNDNPNQGTEAWVNSSAGFYDDSAPDAHSYEGDPTGFAIFSISNSSDNMTVRVTLPRNVAVIGVGPALAELNHALELTLVVQNRGFINETGIVAHLRVVDDGGTEVFNRSADIPLLEVGRSATLNWNWTPLTRKPHALEGWIDWNDSLPGDDRRGGGLNITTIFMLEDFEESTDEWTTINDGTASILWHLTDRHSISGEQSFWQGRESHGSYLDNMDQSLVTPELNLSGMKWVTLSFQHRYHIELNYDGGVVDLSTDNGTTWQRLTPEEGYDAAIAALGGQSAYTGGSEGWRLANFNLTDYVDQTVKLRFRFASDEGVVDEGWFIDDVVLHGTYEQGVDLMVLEDELAPLPGDTEPIEVRVTNSGGEAAQFDLAMKLPEGWSLPGLLASVNLEPSETRILELNLSLPSQVEAGGYIVNLTATHHDDPNVTVQVNLPVEVQEVTGLQLIPDTTGANGEPGELLKFIFQLSNHGNVVETVDLALEGLPGWVENVTVELDPYSSIANVTVWTRVSGYANASQQFNGYVEAIGDQATARANLTVTADQVHGVDVNASTSISEVLPDENLTLNLTLTNTGNGPAWTNATLSLPDGWWASQLNFSAWLARNESASWLVDLIPGWELVDTIVKLQVNASSASALANQTLEFTYGQMFDLRVDPLVERVMLLPDENRTFELNLRNQGNGQETVEFQAWLTNGDNWSLGLNTYQLTLQSGAEKQVEGWYRPPSDALGGHVATLWIVVDSGNETTQGSNSLLEVEKLYGFTITGNRSSIETGQGVNETWGLEVTNVGNVPLEVNLSLEGAEGWHYGWIDDPHLELEVNGRENASVWVTGNRSVLRDTLDQLRGIASAGELEENATVELVMGAFWNQFILPTHLPPHPPALPGEGARINFTLYNQANYRRTYNVTVEPIENWTLQVVGNSAISVDAWSESSFAVLFTPIAEAYIEPGTSVKHKFMVNETGDEPRIYYTMNWPVIVGTYHGLALQGPNGTFTTELGQENPINLTITNLGNGPALLNHTLSELSAGWQADIHDLSPEEALEPGAMRYFSLRVTCDPAALAGTQMELAVILFDNWSADNLTLTLEVAPTHGLAMQETYPPIEVANGENRTLVFIITNLGNQEQAVELWLIPQGVFDWTWGLMETEATVPAFGQIAVKAWVKVPDDALNDEWFKGRMQVTGQDDSQPNGLKVHRDFQLEVADRPSLQGALFFDTFRAGKLCEAYLELVNDGNMPLLLNISVTRADWGEDLTNVYPHYLYPGEEKNITLRIEPPASYAGSASILVSLESPAFETPQTVSGMVRVEAAPEEDDPFPWVRLMLAVILLVVIVALALPLLPWRRRDGDSGDDGDEAETAGVGARTGESEGMVGDGESPTAKGQSKVPSPTRGPRLVDHEAYAPAKRGMMATDDEPKGPSMDDTDEADEADDAVKAGEVDETSGARGDPAASNAPMVAPELLEEPKTAQRLGRTKCPKCEKPILISPEVTRLGKATCFWCNAKVSLKQKG